MDPQPSVATDLPPSMRMMGRLWPGPMAAQAIYVAANLGLADLLMDGPKTTDQLAQQTGTHGPSLGRLLRALAGTEIFAEGPTGTFRNTSLSETLRSHHAESMQAWALFLSGPFLWKALGALQAALETGQPAVTCAYGQTFWEYLAEHPEEAAVFKRAMTAGSEMSIPVLLKAYDFSRSETIIDVGGGHGALLQAILRAQPQARAVLYDLPAVVAGAGLMRDDAVASRCEVRGGDFFESVPEGGDAYVLKGVLHDWSDEEALKILHNCRRAIRPDGRLLIMEMILEASSETPPGEFMDVLMLALTGGRERTESDFRRLIEEAGFSKTQVIRTELPISVIEAQPR